MKWKFDWDDVLLEHDRLGFNSRSVVDTTDGGMHPLIAAPMDTVVNADNAHHFLTNKIRVCLPRGERHLGNSDKLWTTYTLGEFESAVSSDVELEGFICVDLANGNVPKLHHWVIEAKRKFPNLTIMTGNVGSPDAFNTLASAGADYIRVGIGNGGACLTTEQTGVGYPMASLIHECHLVRIDKHKNVKIVADGGFKKYSDINKALALGADWVMIGGIFNKAFESAGTFYSREAGDKYVEVSSDIAKEFMDNGMEVYKSYRGMSTKEVQRKEGKSHIKTSEGTNGFQKVEYTLSGWVENFNHYLATAMSYTGSINLEQFKRAKWNLITMNGFRRFNK